MELLMIVVTTLWYRLLYNQLVHGNTILVFQADEIQSDGQGQCRLVVDVTAEYLLPEGVCDKESPGPFNNNGTISGVGIDRKQVRCVVVQAAVGSVQHDIVNVQHELVGTVEMDDSHIDVLPLVSPKVYIIIVPCSWGFGCHIGFPYQGEVVRIDVSLR